MRSMIEAGSRSKRLFNEVCLPGEKIEKPTIGAAYFSRIGFGYGFREPISKHTSYKDYSFSTINTEETVYSKKGIIKRAYNVPDLSRQKLNMRDITFCGRYN